MQHVNIVQKHKQIAVLAATGSLQFKEIAERVKVHPNTVTRVLRLPEVQQYIVELQRAVQQKVVTDLAQEIDGAAVEAFQRLRELMRHAPPPVALRAAESLLDRSKVSPKRQIHAQHNVKGRVMHVHIGASKLRAIRDVMLEAADDPGQVPEIPPLNEDGELVVQIDQKTGEVLSKRS
jgi:hypothetical protein